MTEQTVEGRSRALGVRELQGRAATPFAYSFCTLVTRLDEYLEMVASFREKGFGAADCEFLYVDNSMQNRFDAFAAYNLFLQEARGDYIVLCHQDILALEDDRAILDDRLAELTRLDACWGICGNAGGREDGRFVYRLTQGDGHELNVGGPLPAQVMSLDENFIVVRASANLALSRDLSGFHWYGADLCIVAGILGWNAHVIDFHLHHKSAGDVNSAFWSIGAALKQKYARAFRSRWHHVPTTHSVFLSSSPLRRLLARIGLRLRRSLGS
jgi:hypothetical protein